MGDEGTRAPVDPAPALRAQRSSREVMDIASALGTRMTPAWNPEEPVSLSTFVKLKEAFDAADADGGGDLDVDEFVRAFRDLMPGADDARLRQLFAKIDVDADERIDWDEFSTYVLLSDQAQEEMREASTGSHYLPPARNQRVLFDNQTRHKDLLTRVVRIPKTDQYASVSRDGTIRAWEHLDEDPPAIAMHKRVNCGSAYLTDAALLPSTSRLAVASFDRRVRVYETKGWTEAGSFRSFDFAPLCCAAWEGGRGIAEHSRDADHLVVGDDGGLLHALTVIDMTDGEKAENPDASVKFERRWRVKAHDDWVNGVCHMDREDAVGSCGADKTVRVTDIERKAPIKTFRGGHHKALHAIAWCGRRKSIYSGGDDCVVQVWTPLSNGPVSSLMGHEASVCDILALPQENQILTLDLSKTVKVWDIRTNRCLQTFSDEQSYHPENRLGRLAFDPKRRQLVSGSVQPKTWRLVSRDVFVREGHNTPVVFARHSACFDQMVTADESGVVCAWAASTGEMEFRFEGAAAAGDDDGKPARALADESRPNPRADDGVDGDGDANAAPRLTCASFDTHGRRLVTGSSDGKCRVWNFANGHRVKSLNSPHADCVTAVAHLGGETNRRFVGVGWNRLVTLWEDDGGGRTEVPPRRFLRGHAADVLCLARSDDASQLATGDADGAVFVWSENGALRHRLEPPPLPADRDTSGDVDLDESGDDYEAFADRSAEAVAFARFDDPDAGGSGSGSGSGSEKTFVVVGHADGHARMWHAREGRLVMDFNAGHRPGESVTAVAMNAAGTRMVTGDSVGRLRLWNVADVADALREELSPSKKQALERAGGGAGAGAGAANTNRVFGRGDVELLGYWQAHASRSCVRDVGFFVVDGAGSFFVTGGSDTHAHVWDEDGRHVGRLGPDRWNLADDATWRSRELPAGGDAREARKAADADKAEAEAEARRTGNASSAKSSEASAADANAASEAANARAAAGALETDATRERDENVGESSDDDELDAAAIAAAVVAAPPPPPPLSALDAALATDLEPSASRPSSSTLSPEPSGYLPVRASEDRRLWTRNVPESFEATDTYRAIVELEERKHDLKRAGLDELRARSEKLGRRKPAWYTRVYIPEGDEHINKPEIPGRPYTSLHHLVHISDTGRVPPAPATNAGKYKYGVKIERPTTPAEEE